MEMLVALTILSAMAALAAAHIGPWIAASRHTSEQAVEQSALMPLQLLIEEIAAAAIDPDQSHINDSEVHLRVIWERLSPQPTDLRLVIESEGVGAALLLVTPDRQAPTIVYQSQTPLRFAAQKGLFVEAQSNGEWRLIAGARLAADAPLICNFDSISRSCR